MSLTSYRAAPPRVGVWWCGCGRWVVVWCGGDNCRLTTADCELRTDAGLGGPGGGRLSRGLGRSIMGAGGFHGRVRDGIGWGTFRQGHQVGQALLASCCCHQHAAGQAGLGCVRCVRVRACGCVGRGRLAGFGRLSAPETWAHLGAGREAEARCRISGFGRADWAIRTARLSALPRVHLRPIDVMVYHGPRGDLVLRRGSRLDAFSGYPGRTWLPGGAAGATTGAPEVRPPRSSRTGGSASQVSHTHGR